jgi:DNA-binding transcriptional regulator LsrR (DeoR family)
MAQRNPCRASAFNDHSTRRLSFAQNRYPLLCNLLYGWGMSISRDSQKRDNAGALRAAESSQVARRAARNRMRIAWMYFVEGMTQNEISDRLGLGRITVIRNIQEARRRNEVKIWIEGEDADCVELEFKLQAAFGLEEAIVVPEPTEKKHVAEAIGAATGIFLSEALHDGMVLGLGWGNTLHGALPTLARGDVSNMQVISLLGGITQAKRQNPTEFAWQVASAVGADCYLLAAPAIVDSPETRRILIERCGLNDIIQRATKLDMAVMSVGALSLESSTFRFGFYSENERNSIIKAGAVGDVLCHFFDAEGQLLDHPLNERVVSVPLAMVQAVPRRVLASGGADKVAAILGAIRLMKPTAFITDEAAARELLQNAG